MTTRAPAGLDQIATGCACFNFRRATRAITQLYDHVLAPSGLRATQLALLVGLAKSGAIPLTKLAPVLGMDRTTLTRNLAPLERDGLVVQRPGADRRVTLLEITPKGSKVLAKAIPLWEQAQHQITAGLGAGRWHALQREIHQIACSPAMPTPIDEQETPGRSSTVIPEIPRYFTLITLVTSIVIIASVWSVLRAAGARASLPPQQQRRLQLGVAAFLLAWSCLVVFLAPAPGTLAGENRYFINPMIPIFATVPLLLVLLAVALSPGFRATLNVASLPALLGLQTWRTIGVVFLALMSMGQLPAHFAEPAGRGDIFIGVTAPLVALAVLHRARGSRALVYVWTIVGLIDLVVAVGMGTGILPQFVLRSGVGRVPPAAAMGVFP